MKILVFVSACFLQMATGHLMDGLYCGRLNCYDVLNCTRDSTRSEISKKYRQFARVYHPDNRDTGDEEKFKSVANAYEILKDEEARRDYDWMLGELFVILKKYINVLHWNHENIVKCASRLCRQSGSLL
jgi:preprotein translocase subunit Sec63